MHDARNILVSMQELSRVVYRNLARAKAYDLLSRVLFKAEKA